MLSKALFRLTLADSALMAGRPAVRSFTRTVGDSEFGPKDPNTIPERGMDKGKWADKMGNEGPSMTFPDQGRINTADQ